MGKKSISFSTKMHNVNILGISISNVNYSETLIKIENFLKSRDKYYAIFTPNTDFIIQAIKDKQFKNILNSADLLIPDGKPLVWASRFLGKPLKMKVSGSEVFFRICEKASTLGYKIFLMGAKDNVANKAKRNLEENYPGIKIVGTYSPPFGFEKNKKELHKIINMLLVSEADILIVGLGTPKQEKFIFSYKKNYRIPLSIGVGASIDFAAGTKKMPPRRIKKVGFAWLWRLLEEPKRLWKRYLIEDMKFFYYVFLQKISGKFG